MAATVADDIRDLVGNTPLLRIGHFELPPGVSIYAKLEYLSPGGSVKDRAGLYMIREAERAGLLGPGSTIIEPTAGNTGIGIALAALGRGYRVLFVVPEKFSVEKQELMRALGAEIIHTPTADGMEGAIREARRLANEIPGSFVPNQFTNQANPLAHYETTGPEIWHQLGGKVDVAVIGVGTGGTLTGVGRYLKERNPGLTVVAVEPEGSVLLGGTPGSHKTEGIGVEFIPETLDMALVDRVITVSDRDAFDMVVRLAAKEGTLVGSSSGAAFYAALTVAGESAPGTDIVVIFPDGSERYLSKKIYQGGV